jgi:hypothetical protein
VKLLSRGGRTSRISRVQTRRIQTPNPIGVPKEMTARPSAETRAKTHHLFYKVHAQENTTSHLMRTRSMPHRNSSFEGFDSGGGRAAGAHQPS